MYHRSAYGNTMRMMSTVNVKGEVELKRHLIGEYGLLLFCVKALVCLATNANDMHSLQSILAKPLGA